MIKLKEIWDSVLELLSGHIIDIIKVVLILVVGFWVIRKLTNLVKRALEKSKLNKDVLPYSISVISISLKVFLIFLCADIIGIETTSILTIFAAASFAIALALQGSLSNMAAGIIILIFRPYRVGNWIEVQGRLGKVEVIQIFHTIMVTPKRKTLIVPNGKIIDGIISNFSTNKNIGIDLKISIPYGESFPKVKAIIEDVLHKIPEILTVPEPQVGIESFEDDKVLLSITPFVTPKNFLKIKFEVHKELKKAFHENKIKVVQSKDLQLGEMGE